MDSKRFVSFGTLMALVFVAFLCPRVDGQTYFSDDFEDPAATAEKWEVVSGNWVVADGVYKQLDTADPWQASMVAPDHWDMAWQEYTIEFKVKILTEGDAPVNVLFRVLDPVPVVWADRNGPNAHLYRWIVNGWTNTESRPYIYNEGTATMLAQTENTMEVGAWHDIKLVVTKTGMAGYVNGVEMFDVQHAQWTEGRVGIQAYSGEMDFDDFIVYGPYGRVGASEPVPDNGATDVRRDTLLSWTPGEFAATHDVYFGTTFEDVNAADRSNPLGVLVSEGQTEASYEPPTILEFGQTYYWRVDEVNGAPDFTIFKGEVWSFTAEPLGYPIEGVVATTNAISDAGAGLERTVDGSGLNELDQHSTESADMWLGTPSGADPVVLDYAFDRVYKLHEMLVWNYNVVFEQVLGFGLKDITVEYSADGVEWVTLGEVELAQATAAEDYTANTAVAFGGVAAQYVRLTINSAYGAVGQYGLSEVRFLQIPTFARTPEPAAGAVDVSVDAALSWRAGREAVTHDVYLGSDPAALALAETVSESTYVPGALDFGTMYAWRVDEVNEAEAISVWEGNVWNFTTQEFAVIDDMEDYDDEENCIFDTWLDGFVNATGSTVGYFEAPFAEQVIVNSGRQSMPLEYINDTAPYYSEAERDLGGMDLETNGADTLRLFVIGQAGNIPEPLYVAVEDTSGNVAVATCPDVNITTASEWTEWQIPSGDLAGVNLGRVAIMYIGLGDRDNPSSGGTGLIFVDDIGYGRPAAVQ
jgi:hypothetical protein